MKTITKQTSAGQAVIEISNGFATMKLGGKVKSTDGMVHRLAKPVEKNGVTIIATICGVGLTADEAKDAESFLKERDAAPLPSRRVLTSQQLADRDDGVRTL